MINDAMLLIWKQVNKANKISTYISRNALMKRNYIFTIKIHYIVVINRSQRASNVDPRWFFLL